MKPLIYLSVWLICFGFIPATNKKNVAGNYEYSAHLIWVKLDIKKNRTFKFHEETHLFGILDEKGTWNVSGDTLITTTTDTIIDKYIISENKLCSVKEDKDESVMCLERK